MDKNQLLGAILISLAIVTYINIFHSKKKNNNVVNQKINIKNEFKKSISNKIDSHKDSSLEREYFLENENLKITFTNKGGSIKEVILKKFDDSRSHPLKLLDKNSSEIGLKFTLDNTLYNTLDNYFEIDKKNSKEIIFKYFIENNKVIVQKYSLLDNYKLSYQVKILNFGNKLKNNKINFLWKNNLLPLETDIKRSKEKATINYFTCSKKFKSLKVKQNEKSESQILDPLKWITMKQRFFSSGIISKDKIDKAYIYTIPTENKKIIKQAFIDVEFSLKDKNTIEFDFFFGPNKYEILNKVTKGFYNNLFTGWTIIKSINIYFTTPLFSFLNNYIHNHGLLIIILVLIIKLLLLPLSFKSQISTSKMKILKPELDKIKSTYKNDKQKIQMAQVSLYKELGINPLSGCIPILLQMPILVAMFNFFPNAIEFRHASFLWVKDLSTFDSVLTLPFTIPIYGNHVSLFALLMTISTILITFFNSQVSSSDVDPSMKIFTYFMPVMFMLILNSHPAALSLYYFISNIMSLAQQYLIGKLIDEKKLEEKVMSRKSQNVNKPRSVSRLEKMLNKKKKK